MNVADSDLITSVLGQAGYRRGHRRPRPLSAPPPRRRGSGEQRGHGGALDRDLDQLPDRADPGRQDDRLEAIGAPDHLRRVAPRRAVDQDLLAPADVVLVNTCAVREKAEDKVIGRAQELAALKRKRGNLVLGIVGCMAEHLRGSLSERVPAIDVVAGPDSYRRLPDLLAQAVAPDRPS